MIKAVAYALFIIFWPSNAFSIGQGSASTSRNTKTPTQKRGSSPRVREFISATSRTEAALYRGGEIFPITRETVVLGQGYDSMTGRFRRFSVDNSKTTAKQPDITANATGQQIFYTMQAIENHSKLVTSLNVSAAASLGLMASGGNARLEIAKTEMQEENSAYLLVQVRVINSNTKLSRYKFRDQDVKNDADDLSFGEYYHKYGDLFVDSITTGGEFFGLMSFRAQNSEQRSRLYGELQAHSGTFQVATTFTSELRAVTQGKQWNVVVRKNGGDCTIPTTEQLLQAALDFAGTVATAADQATDATQTCKKGPVVVWFTAKDYLVVDGWVKPSAPSAEKAMAMLYELYQAKERAMALKSLINEALEQPEDFGDPDTTKLRQKSDELDEVLAEIEGDVVKIKQAPISPPNLLPVSIAKVEPLPIKRPRSLPLKVTVNTRIVGLSTGPADRFLGSDVIGRYLEGFSLQLDPPIEGLSIRYSATLKGNGNVKTVFGQDGELLKEPNWGPAALMGFTVWLDGPLAKYYDVFYRARVYTVGIAPRASNKRDSNPDKPGVIEALKVCVVAKNATDLAASSCN